MASKLYEVNATIIIFVFLLYCFFVVFIFLSDFVTVSYATFYVFKVPTATQHQATNTQPQEQSCREIQIGVTAKGLLVFNKNNRPNTFKWSVVVVVVFGGCGGLWWSVVVLVVCRGLWWLGGSVVVVVVCRGLWWL